MRVPEHLRELYAAAIEQGWTITWTGANHLRWRGPDGRVAFCAGTPGPDPRDRYNVRAKLRRAGLKI